jgi:hypothetical protein
VASLAQWVRAVAAPGRAADYEAYAHPLAQALTPLCRPGAPRNFVATLLVGPIPFPLYSPRPPPPHSPAPFSPSSLSTGRTTCS